MINKRKKIILVGGGTLGSVSPLLAVAAKYEADYVFVGTKHGPEKKLLVNHQMPYRAIRSGKWRRYFSWKNFSDIINIKIAFCQSIGIILKEKPDIILTAGSFVAVPFVWAAWLLRKPVVVHQQDLVPGLANKLMAPFAKKITLTFSEQEKHFNRDKVVLTGNPVRHMERFRQDKPNILITGGGLGARGMNHFIAQFIPKLAENYHVHHILGNENWDQRVVWDDYTPYKFVTEEMPRLLSQADIIISRSGMSLITEAASLSKALILIPMPNSHQVKNAEFFAKHNSAFIVNQGSDKIMERYLDKILLNPELIAELGKNLYNLFPQNAVNNYIILIDKILSKK